MASQAKITSFYRNSKQGTSATLASKRRKALVVEDDLLSTVSSVKSEIQEDQPKPKVEITDPKLEVADSEISKPLVPSIETKPLSLPASELKISFDVPASIKEEKKPATRKVRKTAKSKEAPLITTLLKPSAQAEKKIESPASEKYIEEVTSVEDSHGCSPEIKELFPSTPKQPNDNSTSTRKRKMEASTSRVEKAVTTPVKIEEKKDVNVTPTKVRKRLEMGGDTNKVNTDISIVPCSPVKQVQFLCMGALSPAKMNKNVSPFKSPRMISHLSDSVRPGSKSPAVKSLASVLDKLPSTMKLTPEEVKCRLGKNRNLSELQAKLRKVSDCSAKVKEFQNQIQLKKFSSLEFNLEVPVSPQKSPLKHSPVKRTLEKRPAFERFHALAQPPSSTLVLPFKYKVLAEVFRCLETVVIMLYNRKECIYFSKVKPAVQKMLQRDFTEKHLAQVCYVFPTAYNLIQEKPMTNQQNSPFKSRGYQLTVTPNFNYLTSELFNDRGPSSSDDGTSQGQKAFQPLGPTMLIERRYVFHNRLVKIVKEHHSEFLASYNPLLVVPEHKVTRWHQNFDVDAVPDVPAASLPQPPEVKTFHTAKDVLEHAHNLVKVNPRLEAALKERAALFGKDQDPKETESTKPAVETEKPVANPGLKGVSQSLIDKIRAREAAKAQKQMTMNPEEIRRQGMAKVLPEIARIISSIFVTEKKGVLPLLPLIQQIQYSYKGILSTSSIEEHIRLLQTVIPEWLSILNRATIDYVKINRNIDSNIVYQKLEDNAKV